MGTIPSYPTKSAIEDTDFFPIDSGIQTYKTTYGEIKERIMPHIERALTYAAAMAFNSLFLRRWTRVGGTTYTQSYRDIVWGNECFIGVAPGASAADRIIRSVDGITWTTPTFGSLNVTAICFGYNTVPSTGQFAAVGTSVVVGNAAGTTWAAAGTAPAGGGWTSVCHSRQLQMFAAVRNTGTNRVMTGLNANVWTERTSAFARSWSGICAGDNNFVAISPTHSMISTDGETWTEHALGAAAGQWNSIAWSPVLKMFIAVGGSSSGTYEYIQSLDGITWTIKNGAVPLGSKVFWNAQLGVFVACGTAQQTFAISPDGETWTYGVNLFSDLSNSAEVKAMAWSPVSMRYVALTDSLGNRIAYSSV